MMLQRQEPWHRLIPDNFVKNIHSDTATMHITHFYEICDFLYYIKIFWKRIFALGIICQILGDANGTIKIFTRLEQNKMVLYKYNYLWIILLLLLNT